MTPCDYNNVRGQWCVEHRRFWALLPPTAELVIIEQAGVWI